MHHLLLHKYFYLQFLPESFHQQFPHESFLLDFLPVSVHGNIFISFTNFFCECKPPSDFQLQNFHFLLKCLYLCLALTVLRQFLDTFLKLSNLIFEFLNIAVFPTITVMSVSTVFKFAVFEQRKHSAWPRMTLFTFRVLTRWIGLTYTSYMFLHTLLPILAKTILVVLTQGHTGHLSCENYPVSFKLPVVLIYQSTIGEFWRMSPLTFSHSEFRI